MTCHPARFAMLLAAALALAGCEVGSDDEAEGVYSSGAATILGTFDFDFDEGSGGTVPVPANNTRDVFWERITATDSEMTLHNGARFTVLGALDFDGVTRAQVDAMALGAATVPDDLLTVGAVVAYRTSDGRLGKFRVDGFSGNIDMAVTWVTWE